MYIYLDGDLTTTRPASSVQGPSLSVAHQQRLQTPKSSLLEKAFEVLARSKLEKFLAICAHLAEEADLEEVDAARPTERKPAKIAPGEKARDRF